MFEAIQDKQIKEHLPSGLGEDKQKRNKSQRSFRIAQRRIQLLTKVSEKSLYLGLKDLQNIL